MTFFFFSCSCSCLSVCLAHLWVYLFSLSPSISPSYLVFLHLSPTLSSVSIPLLCSSIPQHLIFLPLSIQPTVSYLPSSVCLLHSIYLSPSVHPTYSLSLISLCSFIPQTLISLPLSLHPAVSSPFLCSFISDSFLPPSVHPACHFHLSFHSYICLVPICLSAFCSSLR